MSVSNPQKTVAPARMDCGGTGAVTLSFDAAAELAENPADIILIMDRSYSMNQRRMPFAQSAARSLLQILADATAPAGAELLGSGTRVGIVSFATEATLDVALTEELVPLRRAISALYGTGNTNHRAAFEKAEEALGTGGNSRRIVIMFTDGLTSEGGDASGVTDRMKAAGVEIYCIGLLDDPLPLEQWASQPFATHVAFTDKTTELEALFRQVAEQVVVPGAREVRIREELAPEFEITGIQSLSQGSAEITGPRTLIWTMDTAGLTLDPATVSLTFDIRHNGTDEGLLELNRSLRYEDLDGQMLTFPNPTVTVSCGEEPVDPSPCPEPTDFSLEACQDSLRVQLRHTRLEDLGRIVQLDVTLKAVCPGKRVAVSILLWELDDNGREYPRGVRHLVIPAQEGVGCRDVHLDCIPFSVPEALNANGEGLCSPRSFQAQFIANYVDTDFRCCDSGRRTGCSCGGGQDCCSCDCCQDCGPCNRRRDCGSCDCGNC